MCLDNTRTIVYMRLSCLTPFRNVYILQPRQKYIQFSGKLTGFPALFVLEVVTDTCIARFLRLFRMAWILRVSCGWTWHRRESGLHRCACNQKMLIKIHVLTDCCCASTSLYMACLRCCSVSSNVFHDWALAWTSATDSSGYCRVWRKKKNTLPL